MVGETLQFAHLILEMVSFIATIIGMTALFFGYRTHRISYKQLNFQIVDRCTSRFHQVMHQLHKEPDNPDAVAAYLGLCNEEVFYFKYRYLPEDIILEWIEGMTSTVPHWVGQQNVNHSPNCVRFIFGEQNLIDNYSRLRLAFTFSSYEEYQILKQDKKAFIARVIKNIRKKSKSLEWEWQPSEPAPIVAD
ncbi:hypothetical protein [Hugenholtzia roseola]|uniref:hypothetical protein n=1 Tax=Hugenholtzia roseola TaxID=1002 RepID=UPI00042111AE|nr:hypothetical protein [Hugenholtzia roseola]